MNGFTTLNRLLGRKNNKNVSKSTSNLSKSTTNLDTSSQYNKIVPLTAMNNAPFEQTFRITVLLPRDQLYVARIGAKTKLDKLLEMICEDKLLDVARYEFRHPADWSQVFDNELSIGEVGLNEIRLVSKSESYNNNDFSRFNHDDIVKLRNNIGRDSLSSSEISRNSRNRHMSQTNSLMSNNNQTKSTTSPYSSSNSLNSMDSTGMNTPTALAPPSMRTLHHLNGHQPVAPVRKKRMAPRPPSQNSIPEQKALTHDYSNNNNNNNVNNNNNGSNLFKEPYSVLPRKNFHVSSPTLYNNHQREPADIDEDIYKSNLSINDAQIKSSTPHKTYDVSVREMNKLNATSRPASMYIMDNGNTDLSPDDNKRNSYNGDSAIDVNHSRTSSDSSEVKDGPLPVPRRRLYSSAPKKPAAPAPPVRAVQPVPSPRASPLPKNEQFKVETKTEAVRDVDVGRETTENESPIPASPTAQSQQPQQPAQPQQNVSKVMLNVDTTSSNGSSKDADHTSYSSSQMSEAPPSSPDMSSHGSISIKIHSQPQTPALTSPTPSISKVQVNGSSVSPPARNKSISSDDEDMKVYNVQAAKSVTTKISVKSNPDEKSATSPKASPKVVEQRAHSPLWTYTLPAPPKFADPRLNGVHQDDANSEDEAAGRGKFFNDYLSMSAMDKQTIFSETASTIVTDVEIKPIIKERVPLDETLYSLQSEVASTASSAGVITSDIEDGYQGDKFRDRYIEAEFAFLGKDEVVTKVAKRESVEERRISVLDELNNVINKNELETLIRKPEERDCFDGANRNTLSNFKIMTYSGTNTVTKVSPTVEAPFDEDQFIQKRSSQEYQRVKRESLSDLRRASDESEFRKPLAPVQRRNLMTSGQINRSDSFHSTRPEYLRSYSGGNNSGLTSLTPRSTSYISLIGAQKFESGRQSTFSQNMAMNRRKSTSEVSICDSPSLQSLEVIKNILNSSKKNLAVEQEADIEEEVAAPPPALVLKESSNTVSVVEPPKRNSMEIAKEQTAGEEPAKKWTYSGPPTINFTTWNERPKIEVSIKSDKDYKFGGTGGIVTSVAAGSVAPAAKVQTPKTEMKIVSREASVEKVGIDLVDSATSPLPPETPVRVSTPPEHLPIVRSVEYKKNVVPPPELDDEAVTLRPKVAAQAHIHERPSYYESFSKPQIAAKPYATLQHPKGHSNSAATQTFSMSPRTMHFTKIGGGPTVKGFSTVHTDNRMSFPASTNYTVPKSVAQDFKPVEAPTTVTPTKATTLNRSRSEVGMKTNFKMAAYEAAKPVQELPFSQHTLRRTGLKEKILATPNETVTAVVPKPSPVPVNPAPPPPPPSSSYAKVVPAPPPQAPPLKVPIVRGVIVKKQLPPPTVDPRDALLESIRNFSFKK